MSHHTLKRSLSRSSAGPAIGITIMKLMTHRNLLASSRQIFFTLFVSVVLFQSLLILTRKEISTCRIPVHARLEKRELHEEPIPIEQYQQEPVQQEQIQIEAVETQLDQQRKHGKSALGESARKNLILNERVPLQLEYQKQNAEEQGQDEHIEQVQANQIHVGRVLNDDTVQSKEERNDKDDSDVNELACKEVHVAMLVWDLAGARNAADSLKTLLHHQVHPLHLHFIVTPITRKILQTLLNTWETVAVKVSFYLSDKKNTLEWEIERFAVLKYMLPAIEQVIYIDNTVRLLDDVTSLLSAENIKQSYLSVTLDPYCTSGRAWKIVESFGQSRSSTRLSCPLPPIIVFNVREMSSSSETLKLLSDLRSDISSEAILSTVSKRLDEFERIPCSWHLPLRHNNNFSACAFKHELKGVVWLSFGDTFSNNAYVEDIKESVRSVTLAPPVIKRTLKCSPDIADTKPEIDYKALISNDTSCAMYQYILDFTRRTHLYFMGDTWQEEFKSASAENQYEVTLLVQTSLDRFSVLERVLKNWNGPAVVVFHVSDEEAASLVRRMGLSSVMKLKSRVSYHVVYKRRGYNAINYLRNIALNNTRTPFSFTLDVDLVPNPGLYESIKKNLAQQTHPTKQLLMVAAFEALSDPGKKMPVNKKQLIPMLQKEQIVGYGSKRVWTEGHKPTNYKLWKIARQPYLVPFKDYFEPYVVVPTHSAPRYDEGLLERMGDKISYTRLLYLQGYTFWALNSDFIIHIPHAISPDKIRESVDKHFEKCMKQFIERDKANLLARFPNRDVLIALFYSIFVLLLNDLTCISNYTFHLANI